MWLELMFYHGFTLTLLYIRFLWYLVSLIDLLESQTETWEVSICSSFNRSITSGTYSRKSKCIVNALILIFISLTELKWWSATRDIAAGMRHRMHPVLPWLPRRSRQLSTGCWTSIGRILTWIVAAIYQEWTVNPGELDICLISSWCDLEFFLHWIVLFHWYCRPKANHLRV
jgi:hypothetical protein